MKILIVEDDNTIAGFVSKGLKEQSYTTETVTTAEEGLSLIRNVQFDAAIVDIMLPGNDGLWMIEKLRAESNQIPILILSAKQTLDDRIRGLQKGGDDYLIKPFAFSELVARLQSLLRRSSSSQSHSSSLQAADLTIELLSRTVQRSGTIIELQPKEFSLLEYMLRNQGVVLSKTMILNHIWEYDFDPQTNVVDVLVHRLRSKIDKDFDPKLIHTIRGVGYVFKAS